MDDENQDQINDSIENTKVNSHCDDDKLTQLLFGDITSNREKGVVTQLDLEEGEIDELALRTECIRSSSEGEKKKFFIFQQKVTLLKDVQQYSLKTKEEYIAGLVKDSENRRLLHNNTILDELIEPMSKWFNKSSKDSIEVSESKNSNKLTEKGETITLQNLTHCNNTDYKIYQ